MDELEKKIEEKAKTKINEESVNAMVESAKNPQNAVRFEISNKVAEKLRTDKEVGDKLSDTANKVVVAGLNAVENEADKAVSDSEIGKLQAYFNEHKEELKTAGIEQYTYKSDMERAVKWHKKCADFHWYLCGWWMTLIRTFFLKAKPFKWLLNSIGVLLNLALFGGLIFGIIKILEIIL